MRPSVVNGAVLAKKRVRSAQAAKRPHASKRLLGAVLLKTGAVLAKKKPLL
jgi:hypothetical protein